MRWVLGLLVLLLAACDSHDEYCTGNVAHSCAEDDHGISCFDSDCMTKHCVEADGQAFCALDVEPRPACALDTIASFFACDGAVRTKCEHGYAVATTDCGDPALCEPDATTCLARPGEDPTCTAQLSLGPFTGYCDGSYSLVCDNRYVIDVNDCGAPELCHIGPGHYTHCILSATPDPRCPTPSIGTGYSLVCDGTLAISCFDGYDIKIVDCAGAGDDSCNSCP